MVALSNKNIIFFSSVENSELVQFSGLHSVQAHFVGMKYEISFQILLSTLIMIPSQNCNVYFSKWPIILIFCPRANSGKSSSDNPEF